MIIHAMKVLFVLEMSEWVPGDGFSSMGAQTGAIKLAMAGT